MKSYTETNVFDSWTLEIYRRARTMVELLEVPDGRMIRCHELTCAVARLISPNGLLYRLDRLDVVDGKYGRVEHSWIVLGAGQQNVILDVYACGRLPQVQLVDTFFGLPHQGNYVAGRARDDIDEVVAEELIRRMKAWL